uniref:Rab-GAP TBC domain-containing protein n=1 Tax=Syphacia muris TaxID=451379 RepID=A0A0N5AH70_9BILA
MVDSKRILANALEDDYTKLFNSDFMLPSLEVSTSTLSEATIKTEDQLNTSDNKFDSVIDMLKSDELVGLNADCKITIKTKRVAPRTLCADLEIRLALSEQDLNSIPPCYTLIETALLCGDNPGNPFDMFASNFRKHCIQQIMKDRYECMFSFDELLAMLAHVSACSISSLLPPGEVSYPAERYLSDQLYLPTLKLIKRDELKQVSLPRMKFLFDLISFWDFKHYGETELMLLLFAFTRIYIDDLADIRLKFLICNAVRNVFEGFSESERRGVFFHFSSVFQVKWLFKFIDKSLMSLGVALQFMSQASMLGPCKLICLRRLLVHLVERAELDPADSNETEERHFSTIVKLFEEFLKIFNKDVQKAYSVLCLLSEVVDHRILQIVNPKDVTSLHNLLKDAKRKYVRERTSNSSILERTVETIVRRIEIWRPRKL